MDVDELIGLMTAYESNLLGEFNMVHVKIFTDGSGRVMAGDFSSVDEKMFEFDHIDELHKFLTPAIK